MGRDRGVGEKPSSFCSRLTHLQGEGGGFGAPVVGWRSPGRRRPTVLVSATSPPPNDSWLFVSDDLWRRETSKRVAHGEVKVAGPTWSYMGVSQTATSLSRSKYTGVAGDASGSWWQRHSDPRPDGPAGFDRVYFISMAAGQSTSDHSWPGLTGPPSRAHVNGGGPTWA